MPPGATLQSGTGRDQGAGPNRHTRRVEAGRRRILVTGATGKVGQAFIRRTLAADVGPLAGLTVRALCHNRVLDAGPAARGRPRLDRRARRGRRGDGRRHARPAPRDVEGDAGDGHGRRREGSVLAPRGCPGERDVPAARPRRRRRQRRPLLLSARRAAHRGAPAPRLSGLLRALEGAGGGHGRAGRDPVRPERLLPARAMDHGDGRLPLPALVRRGRLRRPALARPRRRRARRRLRRGPAPCR